MSTLKPISNVTSVVTMIFGQSNKNYATVGDAGKATPLSRENMRVRTPSVAPIKEVTMPDYDNEYREEYLKSMMNRLQPHVVNEIMHSVESHLSVDDTLECQYEARAIIRIRQDMDRRLAEYRDNA